ncbi:hypothetical protein E2C01_085145 [Portunus trituberculatus]|uniref:Uncharacterized protein n=1 Tax=Portunus trituberculatus TaxID=210409 RepID=A0A5B7J6T6_PORTR|nr:hypothetical protein [Portunus trituberculatus]
MDEKENGAREDRGKKRKDSNIANVKGKVEDEEKGRRKSSGPGASPRFLMLLMATPTSLPSADSSIAITDTPWSI